MAREYQKSIFIYYFLAEISPSKLNLVFIDTK